MIFIIFIHEFFLAIWENFFKFWFFMFLVIELHQPMKVFSHEIGLLDSLWIKGNGFDDIIISNLINFSLKFAIVFDFFFEIFCHFLFSSIFTGNESFYALQMSYWTDSRAQNVFGLFKYFEIQNLPFFQCII